MERGLPSYPIEDRLLYANTSNTLIFDSICRVISAAYPIAHMFTRHAASLVESIAAFRKSGT